MKIVIEDHKVISWNKLYSSKHWRYRSKLAKFIHELVFYSLPKRIPKLKFPVDIFIKAYFKDNRRRDSDNVCGKLYIDGLVPKVLPDDDTKYVRIVSTQVILKAKSDKVLIAVSSL